MSTVPFAVGLVTLVAAVMASQPGAAVPAPMERSLAGTSVALGEWTPLPPPTGRTSPTAIYDPVRDRMVLFGGLDTRRRNDVWVLSPGPSPRWALLATSGTPPKARYQHTAIYDPVRDRMVVFGGDDAHPQNDLWALNLSGTPTWSPITPNGAPPPVRYGHSAIYDSSADRMIIFGGSNGDSLLSDTWELSLSGVPTWARVATVSTPRARYHHTAIADPPNQRMLVFGGDDGFHDQADTWVLPLTGTPQWSPLSTTGSVPEGRDGHVAVYDAARGAMIVSGGGPLDSWRLDLGGPPQWHLMVANPTARRRHAAIYDPVRERMVVFGGETYGGAADETEALSLVDPPTWHAVDVGVPADRYGAPTIYDPLRHRMIMFGGGGAHGDLNDLAVLDLAGTPQWQPLVASGTPPRPRQLASAIYDPIRDRMLVFGGWNGDVLNDLWALSLAGVPAWTPLTASNVPNGRFEHSATYDPVRDRMIVVGGRIQAADETNEIWILPLSEPLTWTRLEPDSTFSKRAQHSAVYDPVRDAIVIHGGNASVVVRDDVWILPLFGNGILEPRPDLGAVFRTGAVPFYDPIGTQLIEWGGTRTGESALVALSLSDATGWSAPTVTGPLPPEPRYLGSGAYDPVADRWLVTGGLQADGQRHGDMWMLTRGTPITPTLQCDGAFNWQGGDSLVATFPISSSLPGVRAYSWTLTSERNWPSFPMHGLTVLDPATDPALVIHVPVPDTVSEGTNRLELRVAFTGAEGNEVSCGRDVIIHTTGTLASLVSIAAEADDVRLRWFVPSGADLALERREPTTPWSRIADVRAGSTGNLEYEDRQIVAGARYAYRLRQGTSVIVGEVWVDVPASGTLILHGAKPNPAGPGMPVAFTLPTAGTVRLETFDVSGRRVTLRELSLSRGDHLLATAPGRRLEPGVYLLRLTFQGVVAQSRAVVVR